MTQRWTVAVALAVMLLLAGCSAGYQPGGDVPEPAPEPAGDHLGYYDGYWYNDTFDIDPSTGLTEAEQEAVFARAMARIQLLRGLRFSEDVEIELISRETYREEYGDVTSPQPSDSVRMLDNAQHEALFLVGPERDVVEVRKGNRGDVVLGFYQPSAERITVVSRNDPPTLANELTLAHELVHALQDQQFNLSSVQTGRTLDAVNARNGLIEGDAKAVENRYQKRCKSGEWQCIDIRNTSVSPGEEFHFGVYFVGFFPYAEGPSFVEYHRQQGGWGAVDAMYDEGVPTASGEIIYPSTYGTDAYGPATVEDRNDPDWERVRTQGIDHASVGQGGLASMFAYTAFEDPQRGVIDPDEFRNVENGQLDRQRPFTYDVSYAEGLYGDRLHAYEDGGETAMVWNVTFNDRANASEFETGYRQVIEFWGGERSGTRGDGAVWTVDGEFRGALWVERDGNSVTIVRAPTAGDLGEVYAPAAA